jgi:hypothetical protein
MEPLDRIKAIGFRKVGSWKLVSGRPVCALESAPPWQDVLYAFVSGGEVLYIGKTTKGLSKRMYGYRHPGPKQRTNIMVNTRIAKHLAAKRPIDVFALCDVEPIRCGEFALNVAAGLEDPLIRELRPKWNTVGK